MPRWPAGLHLQSQSLPAAGGRARRIRVTHQHAYWHTDVAELHAVTPTVILKAGGAGIAGQGKGASMVGPMGVGEKWDVQLVTVSTTSGLNVPVPTTAQVWRAVAGQLVSLLMQTQTGGQDDLGVICPTITAGEQIAVVWSTGQPGDSAWAVIRGSKYVLSATAGQA